MTDNKFKSILYIRFPCWKIYPGGVIYLADFIHKKQPDINQEILDLALVEPNQRKKVFVEKLLEFKPDFVAFSWRNMQTFGPHPENDALDIVLAYDHSPSILSKFKAAKKATSIIYDYIYQRRQNLNFINLAARILPNSRIIVGGTAVSIFASYIAKYCPKNSTVVVGEGEDAILSIVDGSGSPKGEFYYKSKNGDIIHQRRQEYFDLKQLTAVDFHYIDSIFPGFRQHLSDYVGIQTKRGCPYKCFFCLYNHIEGFAERRRDPKEVAKEITCLNKDFGADKFWFTDAQFCSTPSSVQHSESILDGLLAEKLNIRWTGYLRLENFTKSLIRKTFDSGICSIDTTFTGSQEVINKMQLGYRLEKQMEMFNMFKEIGHSDQDVKLYIPFNAPGETFDTLKRTVNKIEELFKLFGRDNVIPFIFFIGVQPGTPIETYLKNTGYLDMNYDPLTLNPFTIKKLLYNPPPLGEIIANSYLDALSTNGKSNGEHIGRITVDNLSNRLSGIKDQI